MKTCALACALVAAPSFLAAQTAPQSAGKGVPLPLTVEQGVPLRVILTRRVPFRMNQTVESKLVEPVFAFDREVIPSGATVLGHIAALPGVPRQQRVIAVLGGDFTPLRVPKIEFDTIVLPDGKHLPIRTTVAPGEQSVVRFDTSKKKKGRVAAAKDTVRQQIESRKRAVIQAVKTPGKMRRLEDALLMRLPYHPQFYEPGSRFDARLVQPLRLGTAAIPAAELGELGSQPATDSVVYARLATSLDSHTAKRGERVEAVLSRPLFSSDHHLVFPEGSLLHGTVVQARPARRFHRGGQLRFRFQDIEPPATALTAARTTRPVEGRLESVEVASGQKVAMDEEGGTRTTSSKKRFIYPALTLWIANRGMDNDPVRNHGIRTGAMQPNTGGRALAGGIGFGVFGAALAQLSRPYAAAMGFYGAGWSIYSNLIARGQEIRFRADTPIEIRFGPRAEAQK